MTKPSSTTRSPRASREQRTPEYQLPSTRRTAIGPMRSRHCREGLLEPAVGALRVTGQPKLHRRPLHLLGGGPEVILVVRTVRVRGILQSRGPIDFRRRRQPFKGIEEPYLPVLHSPPGAAGRP